MRTHALIPTLISFSLLCTIHTSQALYNQQVANRNADILEQEAGQIDKQAEFDIARFDQQFRKSVGTVNVALAKSGVVITSGSAERIKEANALEAEMQNKITRYNADVSIANKMEEARFSRIQGEMARQQARLANISTVAKAGTSLLATSNFGQKSIFGNSTPYETSTTIGADGRLRGGV